MKSNQTVKIRDRKISLKTVVSLLLTTILLTSFASYLVLSDPASINVYLDDLPATATYVIKTDGTNYWAVRYDGYTAWESTNKTYTIQSVIDSLTSGGTIWLQEVTLGATNTYGNNIFIIESYQGQYKVYSNLGKYLLPQLASDPSTAGWGSTERGRMWYNTAEGKIKFWDGSAIQVLPSVVGGGTYTLPASWIVYQSGATHYAEASNGSIYFTSANATYTMQSTIDVTSGEKIFIKAGTYLIEPLLESNAKVSIEGEGQGLTILRIKNTYSGSADAVIKVTESNVTIRHLTVDANYRTTANSNLKRGIFFYNPSANIENFVVEDVEVYDWYSTGIEFTGYHATTKYVDNFRVENSYIHKSNNPTIPGEGSNGIGTFYARNGLIIGNRIEYVKELAIDLYSMSRNIRVIGNHLTNNEKYAIAFENSQRCVASENIIYNNKGMGVFVTTNSNTGNASDNTISNNILVNLPNDDFIVSGIYIYGDSTTHVVKNTIIESNIISGYGWNSTKTGGNSDQGGIKTGVGNIEDLQITGNQIYDCYAFGIFVKSGVVNVGIINNNIHDMPVSISGVGWAIKCNANYAVIENNIIETAREAVGINGNYVNFEGNRVRDVVDAVNVNYQDATYKGYGVLVQNNVFDTWSYRAITINNANCYVIVKNNEFTSGTNVFLLAGTYVIKYNIGYVTENSVTATNTTATTFVFNHGLASTATYVWCSFNTSAITGYTWTSTSTQVTVTVTGTLPSSWITYAKVEYVP